VTLWRISQHADLSGAGGLHAGGRWHSRGQPVVYLADHPASCLLEMLVQGARLDALPAAYQWLRVDAPDTGIAEVEDLPYQWRDDLAATRLRGDAWLRSRATVLLRVPSVIVPASSNYLLNPAHPDAGQCQIASIVRFPLDPRLDRQVQPDGRRVPSG
jgi:RES domain-containing protein